MKHIFESKFKNAFSFITIDNEIFDINNLKNIKKPFRIKFLDKEFLIPYPGFDLYFFENKFWNNPSKKIFYTHNFEVYNIKYNFLFLNSLGNIKNKRIYYLNKNFYLKFIFKLNDLSIFYSIFVLIFLKGNKDTFHYFFVEKTPETYSIFKKFGLFPSFITLNVHNINKINIILYLNGFEVYNENFTLFPLVYYKHLKQYSPTHYIANYYF
ncbi:hypothetical protein [Marinitoga lauensis]|uniref:hypothetical protein n=1 Tax=Marinitoga lauensis TaxID=2201189 RepID=UPI00101055FE|nr:hypothetical protein [Marinitoga lauensis]